MEPHALLEDEQVTRKAIAADSIERYCFLGILLPAGVTAPSCDMAEVQSAATMRPCEGKQRFCVRRQYGCAEAPARAVDLQRCPVEFPDFRIGSFHLRGRVIFTVQTDRQAGVIPLPHNYMSVFQFLKKMT
jgi:hypothetical protein